MMHDRAAPVQADRRLVLGQLQHIPCGKARAVARAGDSGTAFRKKSCDRSRRLLFIKAGEYGGGGFGAEIETVIEGIQNTGLNEEIRVDHRDAYGETAVRRELVGDGRLEPIRLQRGSRTCKTARVFRHVRVAIVEVGEIR